MDIEGGFEDETVATDGLQAHLAHMLSALRQWFIDSLELVLLDGQLAGVSLLRMLIYALITALLGITGWLLVVASLSIWLTRAGWSLEIVLLSMSILSLMAGYLLIRRISVLSRNLTFAATRSYISKRTTDDNTDSHNQNENH